MPKQTKRKLAFQRTLGLLAQRRQAVLKILFVDYREEFHFHHPRIGAGLDDETRVDFGKPVGQNQALDQFLPGLIGLHQAKQCLFAGRAQPPGGSLVPAVLNR